MNTFEKLCEIVRQSLSIEESFEFSRETLLTELGCDSIDVVEIIMDIEDRFDIEISDEALGKFRSMGDIADFIDQAG